MGQLTGITLFSGIGGVACGMQMAGVAIAASVELDEENQEYSKNCQVMHEVNFPDADFYLDTVGRVADLLPGCDILQASPVCKHFSVGAALNGSMQETLADTTMARDVCKAIARCNAPYFFLEQVPGYQGTVSLDIIVGCLKEHGYSLKSEVLDMADYGIPQNRRRYFLLASRDKEWNFPAPHAKRLGWREAITGIKLEPAELTTRQINALLRSLERGKEYNLEKGILVQRHGFSTHVCVRRHNEPCWTITRSSFTDGKGANRANTINVINTKGVWSLPMRAIARLCGVPDWFQLGTHAGQGLGYCVPPRFVKQLLEPITGEMGREGGTVKFTEQKTPIHHPDNSAIAYFPAGDEKFSAFIGFNTKGVASSWGKFIGLMATETVELSDRPAFFTDCKYELRCSGLSMGQITRLAQQDFTKKHRA